VQGSLETPPIVVNGSRGRAVWLLAGSAVMVALSSVAMLQNLSGLLGVFFFGLTGAIGLWQLVAPSRLEIGPAGVSQRVMWRTLNFAWTDIYDFRPATIGLGTKTVGFDYLTPRPGRGRLRGLNTAIAGVQGVLQSGWEVDPVTLAALLNQARERWLGGAASPAGAVGAPAAPSVFAGFAGARMNRKTYLIASALLFAAAIGLSFLFVGASGVSSAFTLFFIRLYAVRLHDLGRSGWWQVVLYGGQIALIVAIMVPAGIQSGDLALGAAFLVQLAFTLGLGAIPGQPGDNRFGPAPGQPSAAHEAEVFR